MDEPVRNQPSLKRRGPAGRLRGELRQTRIIRLIREGGEARGTQ